MPRLLALLVGQGVERPGHLDQVGLMVPVKGVELAGHQKPNEAQMPRTTDSASICGSRTSRMPERSTSWRARFSSASLVGRPPLMSRGGARST